jgi:hypothetical protein
MARLTAHVEMDMILLDSEFIDFPVINLTSKPDHAFNLVFYLTLKNSLSMLWDKDKVISEVIPSM